MLEYRTQKENVEYCWFKSSNVLHSETNINPKEVTLVESGVPGLIGYAVDVKIVFNRGACYIYKNVPIHDYQAFVEHLNRADGESSGKAFNKFIKIYPFEQLPNVDLNKLNEFKNACEKEEKDFEEKVSHCFNLMINGNVTDEYLIERFGKDVFDAATPLELEYIHNLD